MADYFTQFSCILPVGSAENAEMARCLRDLLAAEVEGEDGVCLGFEMNAQLADAPGSLWMYSDAYGDPEHVIRFVLRCANALKLGGLWGFTWSHSCSQARIDGFGGGAHVLDLNSGATVADIDCSNFVYERIRRVDNDAGIAVPEGEGRQP